MASDITPEAVGFLSAVGIFIVALALLFLFINKKLCFSEVGGLPCLEPRGQRRRRNRTGNHAGLVKSFGNEDDDYGSSSSDSEAEIIKQFEISVSRSQSFKNTNATSGGTKEVLAAKTGPAQSQSSRSLNKRHKFSRLSDNEEASIGPPDMEDSAAQPQDPLSATAEEVQTKSTSKTGPSRRSRGSAQLPQTVLSQSRSSLNQSVPSPSLSAVRQEADGSEDFEAPTAGDQDDDSSSTWSPEQEQPPVLEAPLPSVPRVPMSKCADLSLSLDYSPEQEHLSVTVFAVRDLPDKTRSGMDSWQIHMVLLPTKKQRQKTSVQRGDSPEFNETFRFSRIEPSDLHVSALRFRLYAQGGRIPRERMMGEKILRLSELDPEGGSLSTTLLMQPRSNIKSVGSQMSLSPDSASSTQSLTHGGAPELLLGLSYNATTGRMSVEVVKGSHFRNLALSRPPDTYGRLSLLNSVGQEISRCKTSVRRGQPNPVYKETFMFQVALFQLSDVTLLVSVFSRRSMKRKEMVGWVALGQNSSEHSSYLLQTFDHLRTSNVAYFKRKYAEEEEDLPPTAPTAYLHRHLILSEDRSCILALSLEKLRFPVDPEMFLRRSVLIHNLLRKIHRETMAPGSSERSDLGIGVRGPELSSGLKPSLKPSVNPTRKRMRRALTEFQPQTILVYDNG